MTTDEVPRWTVCEASAICIADRGRNVEGRFTGPSGKIYRRAAYADGDKCVARFMPDELGEWTYELTDDSRPMRAGRFQCVKGDQATLFEQHGPIEAVPGARHLSHTDGTPFFYLADTAWSGPLLANEADWQRYLDDRKSKGFTAIQFILVAPWAAALTDADGQTAFTVNDLTGECAINHPFFARMDRRIDAITRAGLLAVPVLAWAANFGSSGKLNPGVSLNLGMLESVVRYQVSRYGSYPLMWILAGDGRYDGWRSWKWKKIGRRVFENEPTPRRPVAMHPMGEAWPYANFRDESWLDVVGYQSSHSDDPRALRWLLDGPPATEWKTNHRPVINLEPCYEGIRNAHTGKPFERADVRRAIYGSLLNAPTAGATYGAHGVWSWESRPREPLNHRGTGVAQPWHEAMQLAGSLDIQRLAALFASVEWWRVTPAPELLLSQPGDAHPHLFISVAATELLDVVIIYIPANARLELNRHLLSGHHGVWIDPSGELEKRLEPNYENGVAQACGKDWILILRSP
jgi:hypothetical protein